MQQKRNCLAYYVNNILRSLMQEIQYSTEMLQLMYLYSQVGNRQSTTSHVILLIN